MASLSNTATTFWTESPRAVIAGILACIILTRLLVVVTYRLFFSPLSKFPGPKLAAATSLYESYFNFIKNGKYVFEIERLHDIYGPIVRVNPYELCIRDADFYDKVYVSGSVRPTENYSRYVQGVDFEGSHFLTTPHDLHRARRKPLEPYFSRLGISQLEPMIQDLAEKFANRFQVLENTGTIVRLDHAMLCYTGDMISRICCENPTSLLDDEGFSADWYESLHTIIKSMPLFEGFPWLIGLIRIVPKSLLLWIDPRSQLFNDWKDIAEKHILEIKRDKESDAQVHTQLKGKRMTLLRHLVNSDLPASELSTPRLVNEAQVLLGTGTIGTSRVLDIMCYYIVDNSSIRLKMAEELKEVMQDWPATKPTWSQLEKLPYFQAVVKEGLRLSYGVMRRLPRVSPNIPIQFREWTIPAGTPVGMSAYMQHTDPTIFPSPFAFRPERWLQGERALLLTSFLKNRTLLVGAVFEFFISGSFYVTLFYFPIYFQVIKGASAMSSGVRLIPLVLGLTLTQNILGTIITITGIFNPFLIAGPAIAAIGGGLLAALDRTSTSGQWIGYQILIGVGVGACLTIPLMVTGVVVKPKDVSTSTAIIIFSQSIGGALMLAAAQGIFQNELLRLLRREVPELDPVSVLSLGAEAEAVWEISVELMERVVEAFVEALQHTFVLTVPVAGVAFLVALGQPWFRYHKVEMSGTGSEGVEVEGKVVPFSKENPNT